MSPGSGVIYRYQTDVNKRTGASITYDISNIGQKTPMFTSEPLILSNGNQIYKDRFLPSYLPIYRNLSPSLRRFVYEVNKQSINQRAAFINKNYTQDQKNNLFAGMPKVQNTAPPDPNAGSGGTAPKPTATGTQSPDPPDPTASGEIAGGEIAAATPQEPGSYKAWKYPSGLGENKQDYIKFIMKEYKGDRNLSVKALSESDTGPTIGNILGTVFLPVQPSITDQNTVDWQNDTINPLQLLGASVSAEAIKTGTVSEGSLSDLEGMIKDPNMMKFILSWSAGKAVGVNNLLPRLTGATVNPNLELLFNGPQLRPFNFTFRLSPRDPEEAKQVKGIIRFFKQGMAVRRAKDNLFLKSPNVFQIEYINGKTNKLHESLNEFKICALTNCTVDYTPDGSYATFVDPAATMTSYNLTLQFNELLPIFNDDYGTPGETRIGY